MENEAPPRRSVAELAGKFRGLPPQPISDAVTQPDKPVRRRPPRTLQLTNQDNPQPPPGASSPPKAKRNSALIEKLQANLTLGSPSAAPLKSPGLRMLPHGFIPLSPGSAHPVAMSTTVTPTSPSPASPPTESPNSFEAPPTPVEGNLLQSINKGRARGSIKRRPPSRRHRKSSSGDDVADGSLSSRPEGGGRRTAGGGAEEEEVFEEEGPTGSSTTEKIQTEETKKSCAKVIKEQKTTEEEQREPGNETATEEEEEKTENSSR